MADNTHAMNRKIQGRNSVHNPEFIGGSLNLSAGQPTPRKESANPCLGLSQADKKPTQTEVMVANFNNLMSAVQPLPLA